MSATSQLSERQRVVRRTVPVRSRGWRPPDVWGVMKLTASRWSEDKIPKLAAALAYYTSFAIAPILLIAIAVAGLVFGAEAARGAIAAEISGLVGPRIGAGIESLLKSAWQPKTGLLSSILGGIALLFGASGVFVELQDSLNIIWKVKKRAGRGVWGTIRDRFLSFSMVVGIGFLLLVSLVLSAGLESLGHALSRGSGTWTLRVLNPLLSFAVISALFGASFKVLPDARTRWRDVVVGGLLTGLLFTLGKFLIGMYLGRATIGSTYGAAGSFVLLLLWIYYSSQIFFLGAEFTKAWADTHGTPPRPDADAVPAAPPPSGHEPKQRNGLGKRLRSLWKRRGWRIGILAGGGVLLVPFLFLLSVVLGINPIVKHVVQDLGVTALAVPVGLDRARISFLGRMRLDGIRISNPPEYDLFDALTMEGVYARIPLDVAFRREIEIPELRIVRPHFTVELGREKLPSNWGRLIRNLSGGLPKKGEDAPRVGRERTFRIGTLRIVEPVVTFRVPDLVDGITVHLKDIELKNAGTAAGSASNTTLILSAVFQALLTGGLKEGKDLPGSVKGPLEKEVSGAVKTFRGYLQSER